MAQRTRSPQQSGSPPAARFAVLAAVLLTVAVLLAHGWSLADGPVLDDYWHQRGLSEHGWSWNELLRSLVIAPADFLTLWWQTQDVRWEYARPLFILAMKFFFMIVGGGDPLALHAYALALHWVSALLLVRLGWLLTRQRSAGLLAGLIFVVYPHAAMTVVWSSSLNCVQATTLMLAALTTFLRAVRIENALWLGRAAIQEPSRASPGWAVLTILLWCAALLTRENALLLGPICLGLHVAATGWRGPLRCLPVYLIAGLCGALFVAWRVVAFTHAMPPVYAERPVGDWAAFGLWWLAKLTHYLCTSVWPAPMMLGPTGRREPWQTAPLDYGGMLLLTVLLAWGYFRVVRGAPGAWVWPLWVLLSVLPVVHVVATPHSGYMGGVGVALAWALVAAAAPRLGGRHRPRLARGAAAAALVSMCVFTMLNRWQWVSAIAAERYAPAWIATAPPGPQARDLYFINLPLMNIYLQPVLVRQLGPEYERIRVHALTFSPEAALVEQRTFIEQRDSHSFSIEIEGQPYFSRLLGRFLLEGFGDGGQFFEGQVIERHGLTVTIEAVEPEGVRRLSFRFERPLSDPAHVFYVATPDCGAARLRFLSVEELAAGRLLIGRALAPPVHTSPDEAGALLRGGQAAAADPLFVALQAGDLIRRSAAESELRPVATALASALAAPEQRLLDRAGPLSAEEWGVVRAWWDRAVDDATLSQVWSNLPRLAWMIGAREEIPNHRKWAALVIRSDLYLTGPPFDSPRPAAASPP